MALKSPQLHFLLLTYLLTIHLIGPVICESLAPITNSSLNTKAIHIYGEETAISPQIQQTKDSCYTKGTPCQYTIDCCQTTDDGPMSCGKFGGAYPTCQPCGYRNAPCSADDMCCSGYKCSNDGTCVSSVACLSVSNACFTYKTCCSGLRCITDSGGRTSCGSNCSYRYGECDSSSSSTDCCPRFSCNGLYCDCTAADSSCQIEADTCCDPYNCDGTSKTCKLCIAKGDYCEKESGAKSCCSSLPCTNTKTASFCGPCVKINENCANPYGVDTCCDGYKCGTVGSTPTCVKTCEIGSPCVENSDCCNDSICVEFFCVDPLGLLR